MRVTIASRFGTLAEIPLRIDIKWIWSWQPSLPLHFNKAPGAGFTFMAAGREPFSSARCPARHTVTAARMCCQYVMAGARLQRSEHDVGFKYDPVEWSFIVRINFYISDHIFVEIKIENS